MHPDESRVERDHLRKAEPGGASSKDPKKRGTEEIALKRGKFRWKSPYKNSGTEGLSDQKIGLRR